MSERSSSVSNPSPWLSNRTLWPASRGNSAWSEYVGGIDGGRRQCRECGVLVADSDLEFHCCRERPTEFAG
jgi:hypothetical protein